MARVSGILSDAFGSIILTPIVSGIQDRRRKRYLLRAGAPIEFDLPDDDYLVESVGQSFPSRRVNISGVRTPDSLMDESSGGGYIPSPGPGGILALGVNDPVPVGTKSGTVIVRF